MTRNEHSGKEAKRIAGRMLRFKRTGVLHIVQGNVAEQFPFTTKELKLLAGSVLTQAADKPKGKLITMKQAVALARKIGRDTDKRRRKEDRR